MLVAIRSGIQFVGASSSTNVANIVTSYNCGKVTVPSRKYDPASSFLTHQSLMQSVLYIIDTVLVPSTASSSSPAPALIGPLGPYTSPLQAINAVGLAGMDAGEIQG